MTNAVIFRGRRFKEFLCVKVSEDRANTEAAPARPVRRRLRGFFLALLLTQRCLETERLRQSKVTPGTSGIGSDYHGQKSPGSEELGIPNYLLINSSSSIQRSVFSSISRVSAAILADSVPSWV